MKVYSWIDWQPFLGARWISRRMNKYQIIQADSFSEDLTAIWISPRSHSDIQSNNQQLYVCPKFPFKFCSHPFWHAGNVHTNQPQSSLSRRAIVCAATTIFSSGRAYVPRCSATESWRGISLEKQRKASWIALATGLIVSETLRSSVRVAKVNVEQQQLQ